MTLKSSEMSKYKLNLAVDLIVLGKITSPVTFPEFIYSSNIPFQVILKPKS